MPRNGQTKVRVTGKFPRVALAFFLAGAGHWWYVDCHDPAGDGGAAGRCPGGGHFRVDDRVSCFHGLVSVPT